MITKSGKPITKPVFAKLTPNMSREDMVKNLVDVLRKSGIKVKPDAKKSHEGGSA
jgi:dihydroorotate dehydrogenase